MTQPQLYQSYAAEKIVSFFGSPDEAQSFCNGQWLIFPKTAICLANVSKWPEKSFFDNGSRFYWVADQPYFAPAHVLGPKAKERAIHLFASPPDSPEFLYVGELEPSYVSVAPGKGNYGMAMFALRPALPSALWVRFGGLPLGDLDFAPIDRALDSLRRPTTVEDRLGVLQQLVEFWHGPIKPEDGMSDAELAGVPLPTPLRWWYSWAGKRTEIMSGQNILYRPVDKHWQLTVECNHLLREFVGQAHADLDRVKELLADQPALVNAAWDWGAGDWETGLGAAAHMGRRDIAEFLLERGARMDVFAAAMLGHLGVVQAVLAAKPETRNSLGPHGISLMKHAVAGGERAAMVVEYLKGLGISS